MDNREIAEAYVASGYRFIPLSGKKPIHEGYAKRAYTLDDLNGHNTGLMIDKGLVDIDLDWPEARMLSNGLPSTSARFGRVVEQKVGITHHLYRCDVAPRDFKLPTVQGAPKLAGDHAHMILQIGAPVPIRLRQTPTTYRVAAHVLFTAAYSHERTLALPKELAHWSLTTLREKLINIGAKVVRNVRSITFQLAEVVNQRRLFAAVLQLIDGLRPRPAPT
jgi:hypothetical protein